jgi:uncharacterized protein YndB with AHSA1/START domain
MSRVMKWILFPILAIAGLVAIAFVVGLLRSPEIRTEVSLEVNRPPETVYKLLSDPNEIPKYWPEVGKIEITQQSPLRYKMVSPDGSGTMEVVSADPPRRIVTKSIEHSMGVDGTWDTTVTPTPTGSRINHKSVMQFHNPLLRTMAIFMDANAEEMKTLTAIKRYAESH